MPFPKHFRFVWRGTFKGTPEAWSFGCHFQSAQSGGPDADLGAVSIQGLADAYFSLVNNTDAYLPRWAHLTDVRAYLIGTNGRSIGNVKLLDTSAENLESNRIEVYPPQIALVASLIAPNRGAAKYGRMYLPTAAPIAVDGRVAASIATGIATHVGTFLKACSDAVDLPLQPDSTPCINVSDRGGPDGTFQVVDHVEVGRVLDTMRSRRSSLVEERQVGAHIDW